MTLPDCMMPDGADPCRAYKELLAEVERLRAENEKLKAAAEHRRQEWLAKLRRWEGEL